MAIVALRPLMSSRQKGRAVSEEAISYLSQILTGCSRLRILDVLPNSQVIDRKRLAQPHSVEAFMVQASLIATAVTPTSAEPIRRHRIRRCAYYALGRLELIGLDWLWRGYLIAFFSVLIGGLFGNVAVSWITMESPGLSDPLSWTVAQPLLQRPEQAALLACSVNLLGAVAYLGHRAASRVISPGLQIFGVSRVRHAPTDRYARTTDAHYLPRQQLEGSVPPPGRSAVDAHAYARALHRAAESRSTQQGNSNNVGLRVRSDPMLGTMCLMWDAAWAHNRTWPRTSDPINAPPDT
jgi:hypothetical protein